MKIKNYQLKTKCKFYQKQKNGFTLIELLVAIAVFVAAVTSITAIYIAIIHSQQKSNIQRLTTQDARYALETITREVRMATGTESQAPIKVENNRLIIVDKNYETEEVTTKTFYVNEDGQLCLDNDQTPITSSNLRVTQFLLENNVDATPGGSGWKPERQPSVTITITTEQRAENIPTHSRAKATLRTTISSRDYRYDQ